VSFVELGPQRGANIPEHNRLRGLEVGNPHSQYSTVDHIHTTYAVPSGALLDYAGAAAPVGFLLCDGSAVSRSSYADLFAAISTTFGIGDGSTTFNLPDFRDRTAIGKSGTKALGATGGSADAIAVSHSHSHSHSGTSAAQSASHSHSPGNGGEFVTSGSGGTAFNVAAGADFGFRGSPATATQSASHTHTFTSGADATSAGLSGTNANLPPYVAVNKIIKT
jgi:microcystin-dependent protein